MVDSLLFRLAGAARLVEGNQAEKSLWKVLLAFVCVVITAYDDYRLSIDGLLFAVTAHSLVSLAKLIPRTRPRIDNGSVHTWDCPLYTYLLTGIPPIVITTFAAVQFENVGDAFWVARSWGFWGLLLRLAPGVALLLIFKSPMNTAYPFSSSSALEDSSPQARAAITTTLQSSFFTSSLGILLGERNLISWLQVLSFVILYVVTAGPLTIGFYPPRLLNLLSRLLRKPQQKLTNEPWQLPFFLTITVAIFVVLFSSTILYWNVNVAYSRDAKNWGLGTLGSEVRLDRAYVPPQPYLFDIVIAHSDGDPIESIAELVAAFATREEIQPNNPRVKIYTKDQNLTQTSFGNTDIAGSFTNPLTAVILPNAGGITATYLYHLLDSWDSLPTQTLFLSTSPETMRNLGQIKERLENYFIPALPLHSERVAEPTTSFLNLGEYSTCSCSSCDDELGWQDTFHLVPSMAGAAHGGSGAGAEGKGSGMECKEALLTYGNNFIAGAERIRGLKRDVYQLLYDALTNPNLRDGWAHDASKIPASKVSSSSAANKGSANSGGKDRPKGNGVAVDSFRGVNDNDANGKGNLGKGEAFGEVDSLELPYLGYTIERLWGILLQCSTSEMAWRCPNTLRGWRRGGEVTDCGCLVW